MKKLISVIITLTLLFSFTACGGKDDKNTTARQTTQKQTTTAQETTQKTQGDEVDYDAIPDAMTTNDGKYQIAFITDVAQLKDKSFNQGSWEGVKRFASQNNKSYKYYQPANGNAATDTDRYDAMKAAAQAGAEIIVCAGYLQGTPLKRAASELKDVKFVFIDASEPLKDDKGAVLKNVATVDFNEEQSGFLAGYAAVKEGYRKLGFTGGGGGTNPATSRFAYGYIQGADAAAKDEEAQVEMNFSWEYGAAFSASPELQTMLDGWYSGGTEIVFCCGGEMCQSAFAAASANDGKVIGVDVDQSGQSDTVLTSATKGLRESVDFILQKYYDGKWDEIGGKQTTLGAKDGAVGLPTDSWSMKKFTLDEYKKILEGMKKGEIKVDRDFEKGLKKENFTNVKLNMI
ncbi:MAG: BMP family ABC transporter substrate-binding protein [Acutalibacteraceae bacterium]|nr:BMP family ABC transporter substrate-binding protein [Acutalibacteraceae bacterium]